MIVLLLLCNEGVGEQECIYPHLLIFAQRNIGKDTPEMNESVYLWGLKYRVYRDRGTSKISQCIPFSFDLICELYECIPLKVFKK